ncbi:hypothetical protein SAMN04488074_105472 [Lentzea albidocapillata subsp. violacea]|uniref:PH domain-containing protein n=1 Tax=Lentzea albidocapillata subsp. violacea TaxID=128104 RepID=A0A1G9C0A1_9PSEU|nr:hypothetical protein [Lentzea albidocapillata]SDK45090.1 hypothetical protein SAMN04488074_105472 [Lentzea albidocapillata subsp. violacea]
MGLDLLPDEHVLWKGKPAHHSVFLSLDVKWIRFSLRFDAVKIALVAGSVLLMRGWSDFLDSWSTALLVFGAFVVLELLYLAEPFLWRYRTLRRTTYYVTDQRVVSVPGRRARSVKLADIDDLTFAEEPDGTGYIRLDRRVMPDGYGTRTVAELIHLPDVRQVVTLLSTLTGLPESTLIQR